MMFVLCRITWKGLRGTIKILKKWFKLQLTFAGGIREGRGYKDFLPSSSVYQADIFLLEYAGEHMATLGPRGNVCIGQEHGYGLRDPNSGQQMKNITGGNSEEEV